MILLKIHIYIYIQNPRPPSVPIINISVGSNVAMKKILGDDRVGMVFSAAFSGPSGRVTTKTGDKGGERRSGNGERKGGGSGGESRWSATKVRKEAGLEASLATVKTKRHDATKGQKKFTEIEEPR